MTEVVLALIETGANQRYLFGTNKLAHAVGASHLTREATTTWVREAARTRAGITDVQRVETDGAEIALTTSGKAMVLLPTTEVARDLVFDVTSRGLIEAPGMRLHGAVSDPFEWGRGLPHALEQVHARARHARAEAALNDLRFGRLPVISDCRYTPLPAACEINEGDTPVPVAHEVVAKARARDDGYRRLREIVGPDAGDLPANLGQLETLLTGSEKWVGVVHADGNGLGEVFTAFATHLEAAIAHPPTDRQHVDELRRLSVLLDGVTEDSLRDACQQTWSGGVPLLLPLVVGGDDLTLVCEGRVAHRFAASFAGSFLRRSRGVLDQEDNAVVRSIMGGALAVPAVGMSVGVAITKPHFPFSTGHDLAVELLGSAKAVKRELLDTQGRTVPSASLDFHVLYDSTVTDLATIRRTPPSGIATSSGPFVIEPAATPSTTGWLDLHRWDDLSTAVDLLTKKADGRRVVPSSQTHSLRTALLRSTDESRRRLIALGRRSGSALTGSPLADVEVSPGCGFTRWIDAMTLADLELS